MSATTLASLPPGALFRTADGRVGIIAFGTHGTKERWCFMVDTGYVQLPLSMPVVPLDPADVLEGVALLHEMRAGTDEYVERVRAAALAEGRQQGRRAGLEEAADMAEAEIVGTERELYPDAARLALATDMRLLAGNAPQIAAEAAPSPDPPANAFPSPAAIAAALGRLGVRMARADDGTTWPLEALAADLARELGGTA